MPLFRPWIRRVCAYIGHLLMFQTACHTSLAYFLHVEGKIGPIPPCGLKIGDAMSLKMYYVMSGKLWHYETVPKRQVIGGIILLGASEHQEMKIHKTWSLCQPQKVLRRSYWHLNLRNFTLPVGKLRSTYHAFMEVLACLHWSVLWFCLA